MLLLPPLLLLLPPLLLPLLLLPLPQLLMLPPLLLHLPPLLLPLATAASTVADAVTSNAATALQIWVLIFPVALINAESAPQWACVILSVAWAALILLVRGKGQRALTWARGRVGWVGDPLELFLLGGGCPDRGPI